VPEGVFHHFHHDVDWAPDASVVEVPIGKAKDKAPIHLPNPSPCELEDFFDYAAGSPSHRLLCTLTVPDSREPASGTLTYTRGDPKRGISFDLLQAPLTQWRDFGRVEAAENAPWRGAFHPVGVIWIWRNMNVGLLLGRDDAEGFDVKCDGYNLFGTSPKGFAYSIRLERI
jgi:hypothetical protein